MSEEDRRITRITIAIMTVLSMLGVLELGQIVGWLIRHFQ